MSGAWGPAPALAGGVLGVALQLQQADLWPWPAYAALLGAGLACAACLVRAGRAYGPRPWRGAAVLLAAAALLHGLCGLRAATFAADALAPELEGRDLQVTGVIAAMPQPRETGLRLRLAVESARRDGAPVALPPLLDLTWYAGGPDQGAQARPPPAVRAGERWRLTVRLKAPHGGRNPHGFDYELWLWEQGVQATGYVRSSGRLDALHGAPERLAATWRYPVERLRQQVRDAILRTLDPGADAARQRAAGVVAALVTGDQRAIELEHYKRLLTRIPL
jgi:competence protein ComEC